MVCLGTLVEWNDQRGFGFIQPDGTGEKVFVHISAFQPRPSMQSRPKVGQRLKFAVSIDNGRKRAQQVLWRNGARQSVHKQADSSTPKHLPARAGGGHIYLLILAFVLLFIAVAWVWGVPRWVFSLYVVMSLITFFAYWKDKVAAKAGRWRTPESTLHVLALIGGWPGALLAQQWMRHKSSKRAFRNIFVATALVNVLLFVWLSSPWSDGWASLLQTIQ